MRRNSPFYNSHQQLRNSGKFDQLQRVREQHEKKFKPNDHKQAIKKMEKMLKYDVLESPAHTNDGYFEIFKETETEKIKK